MFHSIKNNLTPLQQYLSKIKHKDVVEFYKVNQTIGQKLITNIKIYDDEDTNEEKPPSDIQYNAQCNISNIFTNLNQFKIYEWVNRPEIKKMIHDAEPIETHFDGYHSFYIFQQQLKIDGNVFPKLKNSFYIFITYNN